MAQTENKLGVMPIKKLLVVMSVPMMISFFIQALYNMVDSIFVASISEEALTAVSLAFPIQNIITALSVGLGVGINALVPRFLSKGDHEQTDRIAGTSLFVCFVYWIVFAIFGIFGSRLFYTLQTDNAEIIEYGTQYLSIVCIVSGGAFFGQILEKLLVSTGNPLFSMISMAIGAVVNIILDPILIFGLGPIPAMGVSGAAWATVIGQILAAVAAFYFNHVRNKAVHLAMKKIRFRAKLTGQLYMVGLPSMVTIGLGSVTAFCINQICLSFSITVTAVYGIWQKLQNFVFMPIFGMNNGLVPILSYNYGSGRFDRVAEARRTALTAAITLMIVLMILFELIPGPVLHLFSASDTMMAIGVPALRRLCLSMPLGAACIIMSTSFQSLNHASYSLILNVGRQFVFLVGFFWLLSLTGQLNLFWLAVPVTEALGLIIALFFSKKMMQHLHASAE